MFLKILIITVILLSIAMLGMALNILVRKKGRFPAYQVGHNRDMHKLGISCAKHDEIRCHKLNLNGSGGSGATTGDEDVEIDEEHDCAGCSQLA